MPTLHDSAAQGDLDEIRRAVAQGADIEAHDAEGRTPLMIAAASALAPPKALRLLIELGANINAVQQKLHQPPTPEWDPAILKAAGLEELVRDIPRERPPTLDTPLTSAVQHGSREKIELLLDLGADARYVDPCGYHAAVYAVYRALSDDEAQARAILNRLAVAGAPLNQATAYNESPLSVASSRGRFDIVRWLLELGANPAPLGWNELFFAIASGDLPRVRDCVNPASLAARDDWERTPLLLAVQSGSIEIVEYLCASGADLRARGRCGQTALIYAAENDDVAMIRWLAGRGAHLEESDEFQNRPLAKAVERGAANAVRALLAAGADARRLDGFDQPLISSAGTREVIEILVEHGGELSDVKAEARRAFFGNGEDDAPPTFNGADPGDWRCPAFGRENPDRMNNSFREAMIRSRASAYAGRAALDPRDRDESPTWCFSRFGHSLTKLSDGRFLEIAGEHEDHYDLDFCIYNDVVVHFADGSFDLYGYPEDVFPPTDFHTATVLDNAVYIIGSLGYVQCRRPGFTPVYRLDLATFAITEIETAGEMPGWIYDHRARVVSSDEIEISGGKLCRAGPDDVQNDRVFRLHMKRRTWTVV